MENNYGDMGQKRMNNINDINNYPINALSPKTLLNGRYIIESVMSFGGDKITYKAWDSFEDIWVGINEFFPYGIAVRIPYEKNVISYDQNNQKYDLMLKAFHKETYFFLELKHECIMPNVVNHFEENNTSYRVIKLRDGIFLRTYLKQCGSRFDELEAINICYKLLDVLSYIHHKDIIHNEICPNNIYLINDKDVNLLIDYYIAGKKGKTTTSLVNSGFSPFELYGSNSKRGEYSDIYAVGATLYQMVTGIKPLDVVERVIKDELVEPKKLNPAISIKLNNIIIRAMELKPKKRYQSAQEMKNALV
ncbi:MAG: protein kinase [Ruminococcus sp.]|nr:protein kinase [Clostridium sp.]MCM1207464.1 protein kinase [Ruminococcus sp.]